MTLYVLDTDHVSLAQRGDSRVAARIAVTHPEQLAVSIITVQEQLRGHLAQVQHAHAPHTRSPPLGVSYRAKVVPDTRFSESVSPLASRASLGYNLQVFDGWRLHVPPCSTCSAAPSLC